MGGVCRAVQISGDTGSIGSIVNLQNELVRCYVEGAVVTSSIGRKMFSHLFVRPRTLQGGCWMF